jgi:hypothetical protein
MAEFTLAGIDTMQMDAFTKGYITAIFWTEEEEIGSDLSLLSEQALQSIHADCTAFQAAHRVSCERDPEQAGHDFWLTRNGRGAGFWDNPELWGDFTFILTEDAHDYGELSAHQDGETGQIYLY